MQMQMLKIAVVLLIAGSGDARPQASGADAATQMETSDAGWRSVRVLNKSHDIVRDDSRYTGTSGNNRKSYITSYFRGNVDLSRERNANGSRASSSARNGPARSFQSARRSKIEDIWTMPEFRAVDAPLDLPRSRLTSSRIAGVSVVRNSNETNRSSLRDLDSSNKRHYEQIALSNSALALNDSLKINRKSHSEMTNAGVFERSKSAVTWNQNFGSVVPPVKFSLAENNFSANHESHLGRESDGISSALKGQWKSASVRPSSILNESNNNNTSRWKMKRPSNVSSFQAIRTNVSSNSRRNVATDSIHGNRNTIRGSADRIGSTVTPYKDLKPAVIGNSSRRIEDSIRRDGLNNSGKLATERPRPTLIPNPKSEVVGQFASRGNRVTSKRNLVKLRYPFSSSTSNRRNASNILNASNRVKLKNNNDQSAILQWQQPMEDYSTRTAAKRPDLKDRATFELTKNRNSSLAQKSPSQMTERVDDENNETKDEYSDTYSKNWPNEAFQGIEDLYNYEKYTSPLKDESSHEESLSVLPHVHSDDGAPILPLNGGYVNRPDPVLDSSVQKIIQWLKIPMIVPNDTRLADDDDKVRKPIESVLESIYENLDPNRPLGSNHDGNYDTEVVLQEAPQSQNVDDMGYYKDYATQWPSPSSVHSQYTTDFTDPSLSTLTPLAWTEINNALLRNKTVFKPVTHVTQNTVVHILNNGLKKPNVTVTQLKTPEGTSDQANVSSGSSAESPPRPNVHIMFTSQKDEEGEVPTKQETESFPSSSTFGTNCPTIMINTYTRVNNTIQSKEGCNDLNIVVNSHVLNTNVFKPSGAPTAEPDQPTPSVTGDFNDADGSDKYAGDDLFQQDSSINRVTASAGTYSPVPLVTQQSDGLSEENYDSQKDPLGIQDAGESVSTVEVFQGTQISVISSGAPLTDSVATAEPPDASGSSIDGPSVGDESPIADGASGASAAQVPSLHTAGTVMGQSNNALGTLQLPARPNLSIRPGLASAIGSPSSPPASSGSSSVQSDDDDDDDYDMSPGGVLQSIASIFTYFSFMNPVGYSFFSLAAAPFAAMAAGVLGVAAVVFPWALPNVLDLGRAADSVTVRFRPSLEEFVRQAVHKYARLNEWKSKRRKRRR